MIDFPTKTRVSLYTLAAVLLLAAMPTMAQKRVAPTQQAVTKRNRSEGKPVVLNGIRETVLPNGMTVLTKEVHASPVVYFGVYYKVGSVNEQVGQTGMSHLMEHMMFKGTKSRGPGVISSTLQKNGADFNASTGFDRTEYHETLASDRIELAMQIESDRMVNSVYDEAQHQKEMTVVRSEYEAGENDPGNALSKAVRLAAYQVHPYRWLPIGFRSDIENFSRDEMYAYYKNYYAPNNATLVMVGDFDTTKAMALARKYFGVIPARRVNQHFITSEPAQQGERRVVVRRSGTTPLIEIAYHIPGVVDNDQYALDVLQTVLSGGRTARFFLDLVQTGLASGASVSSGGTRDPDLITFDASAQPGHTNAELEKALLGEIDTLQKTPISSNELTRAVNQAEAEYVFGKDSVEDQGDTLGENAMRGDWRYGETYLQRLSKVTPADVQRVAKKYLVESNRTVGYFEPIGTSETTPVAPTIPAGPTNVPTSTSGSTPARATTVPNPAPISVPKLPVSVSKTHPVVSRSNKPTKVVLSNGLTVVVQENHANPTVALSGALMSAGGVFDPSDKPGLAVYTASQLSRGTETRSLLDIAQILEGVDATVSVGGGDEFTSMGGRSLTKDFPTMLEILADELRHPSFPSDELEKSRTQILSGLEEAHSDTGTLADIAFHDAIYPKNHPYSEPTLEEQVSAVKSLTRDDLVRFHQTHYVPNRLILTIVGDVDTQAAIESVKTYFGDWKPIEGLPSIVIPTVTPKPGPLKSIVIPVPDKAQVDVRYGFTSSVKRSDPDFYAMVVMNEILGGGTGLTSLLGVNIRDRLGLVYGVDSDFAASLGAGPFTVSFGANPSNVDPAVAEMQRVIAQMREHGVTTQQVSDTIAYLTGSYPVTLSTSGTVASVLLNEQIYGLGLDYMTKRNDKIRAVTVAQVNAVAKRLLNPTGAVLVIAGTYSGKYTPR